MKNWFIKIYRYGEGWFKQNVSIELKLYVFVLIALGLFVSGYLVGKL